VGQDEPVPSPKTALTELATAVGFFYEPAHPWPDSVEEVSIPGIPDDVWRPLVAPVLAPGAHDRELLLAALSNGRAFRLRVLDGRLPHHVEWAGADKTVWSSEIPRDLEVDDVYFIQAKHDSTCVLNTSPFSVFELLLAETDAVTHESWYEQIARLELQAYYDAVRQATIPTELPPLVDELDKQHRAALKQALADRAEPTPDETRTYAELVRVVSERSANHWIAHLSRATPGQRTRMLLRMLRVAGGPYWLLGTKGNEPLQLEVGDTRRWRTRFDLRSFDAQAAGAGQPQVNWRAEVIERDGKVERTIEGYCEIRWSHGKLQGSPECKVQVTTPLPDLPGYDPM
jgi:hypothetical protein